MRPTGRATAIPQHLPSVQKGQKQARIRPRVPVPQPSLAWNTGTVPLSSCCVLSHTSVCRPFSRMYKTSGCPVRPFGHAVAAYVIFKIQGFFAVRYSPFPQFGVVFCPVRCTTHQIPSSLSVLPLFVFLWVPFKNGVCALRPHKWTEAENPASIVVL